MSATALRCTSCSATYPLDARFVCDACLAPLEPAYDLAQWFGNRIEAASAAPYPVAAIRRQIDQFSRLLDLDPARIAGWAFVKSIGWDWGPEAARLFHDALIG